MNVTSVSAFLSTALAIYCTVPYVQAILKGRTRPHQLAWLVFVIMNGVVFFSQFFAGGRVSVLISLAFFIGSFIVLLLSLKFGVRDTSRWDRILFVFAILTIIVWSLTRSNEIAIWLTLLIDLAATTMMILKLRKDPHSEAPYPWILASLAYVFTCLTLVGKPLGILYVRPLYGLICDVTFVGFILYYHKKAKVVVQTTPAEL